MTNFKRSTLEPKNQKQPSLITHGSQCPNRNVYTAFSHVLTEDDAAQFSAAIANPRPPTARAKIAAKIYRARVIAAD